MLRGFKFVAIALAALYAAEPAMAQYQTNNRAPIILLRKKVPPYVNPNLNLLPEMGISPSQAAAIAKAEFPGAKILRVRERGSVYVVTLVFDGNVIRVRVDGTNGSIL